MAIEIDPENEGKFTATQKRTGKTTAELRKSKNPLTRKRAVFAENAKKWAKNRKSKTEEMASKADRLIQLTVDDELHDSRLYSNLRGVATLESREDRLKAHKKLGKTKHKTIVSAAKSGFKRESNQEKLSSKLERIIRFDAPLIDSWNPIKRHKQHKALQQWVDTRPPSAGITAEDVAKQYPEDKARAARARKGLLAGAVTGGVLGSLPLASKHNKSAALFTIPAGAVYGGLAGGVIANLKKNKERFKEYETASKSLTEAITGPDSVPAASIKTSVPRATSYKEVTSELKKQGIGPVRRNLDAALTRPYIWSGSNALFDPRGDKGLIITTKNVHPTVFKHEAGHAKDYAHYGGEKGFRKAYPHYGDLTASRENRISSTLLAEHRAWAYAKPASKKDKKIREDALTTYKHGLGLSAKLDRILQFNVGPGIANALKEILRRNKPAEARIGRLIGKKTGIPAKGWFPERSSSVSQSQPAMSAEERLRRKMAPDRMQSMSATLDRIIEFADPRPRNPLGEFTGSDDGVPDPNTMVKTYGQNLAGGAVAGVGAGTTGFAVKSLLEKIKKSRKKL